MPNPEQARYIPRSSRTQELRSYVRQEIDDLRAGKIERLSTDSELCVKFGYREKSSPRDILQSAGLLLERRLARQELKQKQTLEPSSELAWLIGILAAGGYVNKGGSIELFAKDSPFLLDAFKSRGEGIFRLNAQTEIKRGTNMQGKNIERSGVAFCSTELTRQLGDLRRNKWVKTIHDNHRWILEQDKYSWRFIEGFFEKRGNVYIRNSVRWKNSGVLLIKTSVLENANFLSEVLVRLGIEKPTIRHFQKEGIVGVALNKIKDIRKFANNIHSVSPDKEAKLDAYRNREYSSRSRNFGRSSSEILEDAIREYKRLSELYGRPPNSSEISVLRKQGQTLFSTDVYITYFGDGTFKSASKILNSIVNNETDLEIKKYRTPRVVPKRPKEYISSTEDVIDEWKRLKSICSGKAPSYSEVELLRKQGETRFSSSVYAKRFGDGSFEKAKEALDRLAEERSRGSTGVELKSGEETQIFP